MVDGKRNSDSHVGELLSGYVDGELTQQQRQLVSLHCDECDECRDILTRLRELRQSVGKAHLSELGEDKWRETMNDSTVQTTRRIGWLMLIAGLLVIAGIGIVGFLFSDEVPVGMKLIIIAVYGGLATLLFSVLRQRLIERKTDKYKDVEI
ncbi:MAG: zf-HC2 domain-containing protein [Xanthomonadales bacterium]|nr:zf-HC2 domain-containing protein [Xanthomonadales bacterium]